MGMFGGRSNSAPADHDASASCGITSNVVRVVVVVDIRAE
jgi:hypothetical protein